MRSLVTSPALEASRRSLFDGAQFDGAHFGGTPGRTASLSISPLEVWWTGMADALAVAVPSGLFAAIMGVGLALFL